jgi:hypothetical protein
MQCLFGRREQARGPKERIMSDALSEDDRYDVEDQADKGDNPPAGSKVTSDPKETKVEVPDGNGGTITVRKISHPEEDGPTHILERPDGTVVKIFDDYIEITEPGPPPKRKVYDRNSGEKQWEDEVAADGDSDSILDETDDALIEEWADRFRREQMSREELDRRLRSRGKIWDPGTGRPRDFTKEELERLRREREERRRARLEWLRQQREQRARRKAGAKTWFLIGVLVLLVLVAIWLLA